MSNEAAAENLLREEIAGCFYEPLRYVRLAFPWGKGPLADETGPDAWQREVLTEIGNGIRQSKRSVRVAIRSGHGVGKTALSAWLTLWWQSTRPNNQQVTTANTRTQLTSKTWRELAKWSRLAINRHWFDWTATKFAIVGHEDTWYASAIPWTKNRSEAFAGTHEKYVFMLFDEGSAIDDVIWEVSEGAMTTAGSLWVVLGNPTRNTGRFHGCFHRERNRWSGMQVDSRKSKQANQDEIREWIENYGEDSDFVRIRIKGEFPRAASTQFIGNDLVEAAVARTYHPTDYSRAPVSIGVDVARFGDDKSVIYVRKGLATIEIKKFSGIDTMQLAGRTGEMINAVGAANVFVDDIGVGAGVVDRLRQLGFKVIPVNAGSTAADDQHYYNLRAEMWGRMRDWLKDGGSIPDDADLKDDLIGVQYGFDNRNRIQLERKEDMKRRGLASPDSADALALTFALPTANRDMSMNLPRQAVGNYNEF